MTNLLAITILAISSTEVKTNTVETFTDPASPLRSFVYINDPYSRPPPPKEKWVVTIVTREDKIAFDWQGKRREVVASTIVSSNCVAMRRKEEWEPMPQK